MGSNLTWLGSLQEWEIRAQSLTEERLYEDTEMTIIYKPRREISEEMSPADTLILDFQPPELRHKCLKTFVFKATPPVRFYYDSLSRLIKRHQHKGMWPQTYTSCVQIMVSCLLTYLSPWLNHDALLATRETAMTPMNVNLYQSYLNPTYHPVENEDERCSA